MITIPIWLLIVAMLGAFSGGYLVVTLSATTQAKRWHEVRDCLRNERDELRDRLSEATKRLRECEAVLAKIRQLLPETSGTITRS